MPQPERYPLRTSEIVVCLLLIAGGGWAVWYIFISGNYATMTNVIYRFALWSLSITGVLYLVYFVLRATTRVMDGIAREAAQNVKDRQS